jgi:predicted DsbA family dithiol-disulfide isomerase
VSDLVVYGDFNCPFSALASHRVDRIVAQGRQRIRWCAVEHDEQIPAGGLEVADGTATALADELATVAGLLRPGEADRLHLPLRQVNTRLAVQRYAGTPPSARPAARAAIFAAHWEQGRRIDDAVTLDDLGAGPVDAATAEGWRARWLATDRPIVPALVLADGTLSRGLGALERLAVLLDR